MFSIDLNVVDVNCLTKNQYVMKTKVTVVIVKHNENDFSIKNVPACFGDSEMYEHLDFKTFIHAIGSIALSM